MNQKKMKMMMSLNYVFYLTSTFLNLYAKALSCWVEVVEHSWVTDKFLCLPRIVAQAYDMANDYWVVDQE